MSTSRMSMYNLSNPDVKIIKRTPIDPYSQG